MYRNFTKKYKKFKNWNIEFSDKEYLDINILYTDEYFRFINENGYGSYMNGFFNLIPPHSLIEEVNEWIKFKSNVVPFAYTGLGDIYFLDENYVKVLYLNHGIIDFAASSLKRFFNKLLCDETYINNLMKKKVFDMKMEDNIDLNILEILAYQPALALGGKEKNDYLVRVSLPEYIGIISNVIKPNYKKY